MTLPLRLGGLGLRSADRLSQPAFWASWADALPMIAARLPELADKVVESLQDYDFERGSCLAELDGATRQLD
eukprot:6939815-Karenia_brevis.AAC.1